jgi:predicted XRE-type DNA-binding protein
MAVKTYDYEVSSGNVFADLGLPKSEELLAKAELAVKIISEIERRGLTQSRAASLLGLDQPKVSALKQGRLSGFSIERLLRLVLLLGNDVDIVTRRTPKSRSAGRLRVA